MTDNPYGKGPMLNSLPDLKAWNGSSRGARMSTQVVHKELSMEQEPAPYLIIHKVRGDPAFDIATLIGHDEDGTEMWIIPTSGHRAYPYRYTKISDLIDDTAEVAHVLDMPDPWPDHYACNNPGARPSESGANLLDRLGLAQKIDRRF